MGCRHKGGRERMLEKMGRDRKGRCKRRPRGATWLLCGGFWRRGLMSMRLLRITMGGRRFRLPRRDGMWKFGSGREGIRLSQRAGMLGCMQWLAASAARGFPSGSHTECVRAANPPVKAPGAYKVLPQPRLSNRLPLSVLLPVAAVPRSLDNGVSDVSVFIPAPRGRRDSSRRI